MADSQRREMRFQAICLLLLVMFHASCAFIASSLHVSSKALQHGSVASCRQGRSRSAVTCRQSSRRMNHSPLALTMSEGEADFSLEAFMKEVERRDKNPVIVQPGARMDGPELRQLVQDASLRRSEQDKWGYPLETRLHKRRDAFGVMKVMWKHLWEASFPMTEEQYDEQIDAVAWYISEWELSEYVRQEIASTTQKPGLTVNGGAKTVMIPLNLTEEQIAQLSS